MTPSLGVWVALSVSWFSGDASVSAGPYVSAVDYTYTETLESMYYYPCTLTVSDDGTADVESRIEASLKGAP